MESVDKLLFSIRNNGEPWRTCFIHAVALIKIVVESFWLDAKVVPAGSIMYGVYKADASLNVIKQGVRPTQYNYGFLMQ